VNGDATVIPALRASSVNYRRNRLQALIATILPALCALSVAQSGKPISSLGAQWKEYVYSNDGFAATFPYPPTPHKDTQVPDGTAYTVALSRTSLTLHVANYAEGCKERFTRYVDVVRQTSKQLQDGTLDSAQSDFRPDVSSIKEILVGGYLAIEHEQEIKSLKQKSYERWQCVGTRLYIFTTSWPREQPRPPDLARVVTSFRLLPK
jgi:hypothetical protein